jgi:hypothetical protein
MLEVNLTNEEKVNVTLHPVTSTGKPATVDGVPTWAVVAGTGTTEPASDGMSCFIISSDAPGDTDVQVEADADLGAGVTTITDLVRAHVAGAQAEALGVTADTPVPK